MINANGVKSLPLKNAPDHVLLDGEVYEYFNRHDYFSKIKLLENLRKHSTGCVVFQKSIKEEKGKYKTKTYYLHKLVAETFLSDFKTGNKTLVGTKNNNKLDCRKDNLIWRSRARASRQRKTTSKTGFTGVYRENQRYRAVISHKGKSMHLGMFDTAREAAEIYNRKSWELYGHEGKQNKFY